MEIEKLIEILRGKCAVCKRSSCNGKYWQLSSCPATCEAADALEHLQAENDRLHDELEKVDAERDAAVNDLNILRKRSGWKCYACFYDDHYDRGVCAGCGYNNDNNWQWRGQKEE